MKEHMRWVKDPAFGQRANLSRMELASLTLSGIDLSGAILVATNCQGTRLSDANLSNADLIAANLTGTDLSSANLRDAKLSGTKLDHADLTEADLRSGRVKGADGLRLGRDVTLAHARMSGVREGRTSLFESRLKGSDLDEANFANVDLSEANLKGPRHGQNTFSIRKYYVTNKHGLNHGCHNAKLHTT
jgi:uncharacterized protein YjbI with pentapeptide repeats